MRIPAPKCAKHLMDVVQTEGAQETWQRLESGEVTAFFYDHDGVHHSVDAQRWRQAVQMTELNGTERRFLTRHPCELLAEGRLFWITDRPIYLPNGTAEESADGIGAGNLATTASARVPDRQTEHQTARQFVPALTIDMQSKHASTNQDVPAPRGRGNAYDWESAIVEMGRIVFDEGAPETQAALERKVAAWFAAQNKYPSESSIKQRVRKVFLAWGLRGQE